MSERLLNVVGGTYREVCRYPSWDEVFGSGGRAVEVLLSLDCRVKFHSYMNERAKKVLTSRSFGKQDWLELEITPVENLITFDYIFALATPQIYGYLSAPSTYPKIHINDATEDYLIYGMIENDAIVHGRKIVYDPQNPKSPKHFHDNGSSAKQLAIVLNEEEARRLIDVSSERSCLQKIGETLLEHAQLAIIKLGVKGALLFETIGDEVKSTHIPVYQTEFVWKIGTGDVFSATFAYYWIVEDKPAQLSANFASQATALYANTKGFLNHSLSIPNYPKLESLDEKKVYLAGPFFTMSELWLIEHCRQALIDLDVHVFSPYHDVGIGLASEVVHQDIKAIEDCDVVFAILDGLDPGTIFEIGYARALNKKVVIYYSAEYDERLKMMKGSNCMIHNDLVTALYMATW